ncbi:MAG: hypothetical protein F6K54_11920 [Okeania sp. SIO3B5]|uniref:hypothetical protein n=1 Tax=Okeania sp. SIO3B5 TaxID=2607811 RepID=UPI0013FFD08A|nr:hypothetical protein [Okeania sp. SIO3B5]NEO53725.1 hypothetical protein [Okeania sp. SIO3B5]
MGRWGDGEMGRWGDGEMGRKIIVGFIRRISCEDRPDTKPTSIATFKMKQSTTKAFNF